MFRKKIIFLQSFLGLKGFNNLIILSEDCYLRLGLGYKWYLRLAIWDLLSKTCHKKLVMRDLTCSKTCYVKPAISCKKIVTTERLTFFLLWWHLKVWFLLWFSKPYLPYLKQISVFINFNNEVDQYLNENFESNNSLLCLLGRILFSYFLCPI